MQCVLQTGRDGRGELTRGEWARKGEAPSTWANTVFLPSPVFSLLQPTIPRESSPSCCLLPPFPTQPTPRSLHSTSPNLSFVEPRVNKNSNSMARDRLVLTPVAPFAEQQYGHIQQSRGEENEL
jgi:hypothetical protein